MTQSPYTKAIDAAERAETPYILFAEDLARRLRLQLKVAEQALRQGWFGPWLLVNGEPAITRDSFKSHLRRRMAQASEADRELVPGRAPNREEAEHAP